MCAAVLTTVLFVSYFGLGSSKHNYFLLLTSLSMYQALYFLYNQFIFFLSLLFLVCHRYGVTVSYSISFTFSILYSFPPAFTLHIYFLLLFLLSFLYFVFFHLAAIFCIFKIFKKMSFSSSLHNIVIRTYIAVYDDISHLLLTNTNVYTYK